MLKPMLEVLCLCAGAAAGIFFLNYLSDNGIIDKEEHKCNCHHDADGDHCCGGCGNCHCKDNNNDEE